MLKYFDCRRMRLVLLALVLLFGQAAMLAHGSEHVDEDETGHACLVCVAAHNVVGPTPPATTALHVRTDLSFGYAPVATLVSVSIRVARRFARGPPLS